MTSHVQHIMQVPVVFGKNPVKVPEFYEKLVTHLQALETMGKLQEVINIVFLPIKKLPGVRAELVINGMEFPKICGKPEKVD